MISDSKDDVNVIKIHPDDKPERPLDDAQTPQRSSTSKKLWCTLFLVVNLLAAASLVWLIRCPVPRDPLGCNSDASFSRPVGEIKDLGPFSYIIASDTQFPWIDNQQDANERCAAAGIQSFSKECTKWYGRYTNRLELSSMLSLIRAETVLNWPSDAVWLTHNKGGKVTTPRDVVINGDLTAYYHEDEAAAFASVYHSDEFNLYPGLGNHDYTNNAAKCYRGTFDANCCTKNAIAYMKQGVACNTIPNFPSKKVASYDARSMAYSWNVGRYHFVQLQYHPFYENTNLGIYSSIDWLEDDLKAAYQRGQYTVVFSHVVFNNVASVEIFANVTRNRNVVAIFHGHRHDFFGNMDRGATGNIYPHDIPVFFSGSSGYKVFLLAEFRNESFSVGVVNTTTGVPTYAAYKGISNRKNMVSFAL